MRLHRLELSAFGPFPGTEVVDFERLNAAGLFLLTGPTGGGKTSILDAICFALYGAVPGGRNGAKAFKSDHASPDAVPSVTLELTVRDRRLRVQRQPRWSRPSRRARAGAVVEQAKATLAEYSHGDWQPLSSRVDEVGHLVTSLLGMNKDQFCQVVLLPQGEFQTFLSAGAKERHDVLESLFRTHRFQAIERWLVDHRRELDGQCRETEAGLDRLLARVDEVLAGLGEDTVAVEASPQTRQDYAEIVDRVQALRVTLATVAVRTAQTATEVSEEAKAAQHALDEARHLIDLQRRHRDALNRRDELRSAAGEVRRREREVLLARRAAVFVPLLDLVAEAEVARSLAATATEAALAAAWRPDTDAARPTTKVVAARCDALHREVAALEALLVAQQELDTLTRGLAALAKEIAAERADEAAWVTALARLPEQICTLRATLASARDSESRLPAAIDAVTTARTARDAAGTVVKLGLQVEAIEAERLEAREVRANARDHLHDVRTHRIAGVAAHLATFLDDGEPCPVCGSAEHPAPAMPAATDTGPGDEAAAEEVVRRAEDALGQLELRRERIRSERTAADHAAGGLGPGAAEAAWTTAVAARHTVTKVAQEAERHADGLAALEQQQAQEHEALALARASLHAHQAQHAEQTRMARRLQQTISDVVPGSSTVGEHCAMVRGRLDSTIAVGTALRSEDGAGASWRAADDRLNRLVADSVFATVAQVRAAIRNEADIASGEALNRAHAAERAATDKALADPTLVQAAQLPTPDVVLLALAAEQDAARAALATATAGRWQAATTRMDSLAAELGEALAVWQPMRRRRDRADHVASMVAGTSRDNVTKTKLSHYVLAARLEQVVDAANARLSGICGGRFELEHTLLRGVGDARGGLGLRVLDTYTGARRDPATLSGGETFYVSLALALGLADLVNNEIGGAELSTLFVDEGFGTLDADTLDEVMDELDALRSGGRSVGLVSHLAELRIRVPAQLSVVRSPEGSRLDDSR